MKSIKKFLLVNKPLVGLFIFSILIGIINPRFFDIGNFMNIFRQTSVNAIIAVGMTLVILTAGIDLSVGSILAITGAIGALLLKSGMFDIFAILLMLILGGLFGMLNGVAISKLKLQPFIVTLVSMTMLRGFTLVVSDGRPISIGEQSEFFSAIGNGYLLGIPIPVILMLLIFLFMNYTLKNTRFGRYVYAIGGNEEATILSGINTAKYKTFAYILSGIFSALAAVIITSRLSSAQPTAGNTYELDAIAAVVLGGTSLAGGVGSIGGTLIRALIIGVLSNALNLLEVTSYYQTIVKGLVIFVAVVIDMKSNT